VGKYIPYRGQPEPKYPPSKPKRILMPKEKRRENIIGILRFLLICGIIFFVIYFASDFQLDQAWKPALFIIAIFLLPFGLNAGIDVWNKYLRGDDLNDANDADEKQEE
jgi:hypothetical protein